MNGLLLGPAIAVGLLISGEEDGGASWFFSVTEHNRERHRHQEKCWKRNDAIAPFEIHCTASKRTMIYTAELLEKLE